MDIFFIISSFVLISILSILIKLSIELPFCNKRGGNGCSLFQSRLVGGAHMMVLLGSGGHTGEMLRILNNGIRYEKFKKITWVTTDENSLQKSQTSSISTNSNIEIEYMILPRARNVGQSFKSSILTTLRCLLKISMIFFSDNSSLPDVVLCNGPGTSVPLCYLIFLFKFLKFQPTRGKIIYIESLARVNRMSLSGWLVYPIANRFIVQWEKLHQDWRRTEYHGFLV